MQVTEAPVSTSPRTRMPSRVSWPVMGGPTAHPTGVTLASGDPPNSLNAHEGSFGRHLLQEAVPRPVLWEDRERYREFVGAASVGGRSEPGSLTKCPSSPHRKQRGGRLSGCWRGGQKYGPSSG